MCRAILRRSEIPEELNISASIAVVSRFCVFTLLSDRILHLLAFDTYTPRLGYTTVDLVEIPLEERKPPEFTQNYYVTSIIEGWTSQTEEILWIRAQYWESTSLIYELISPTPSAFDINPDTGQLYVIKPLDRESSDKVQVKIRGRLTQK